MIITIFTARSIFLHRNNINLYAVGKHNYGVVTKNMGKIDKNLENNTIVDCEHLNKKSIFKINKNVNF